MDHAYSAVESDHEGYNEESQGDYADGFSPSKA